jgi:hypothetical protein
VTRVLKIVGGILVTILILFALRQYQVHENCPTERRSKTHSPSGRTDVVDETTCNATMVHSDEVSVVLLAESWFGRDTPVIKYVPEGDSVPQLSWGDPHALTIRVVVRRRAKRRGDNGRSPEGEGRKPEPSGHRRSARPIEERQCVVNFFKNS